MPNFFYASYLPTGSSDRLDWYSNFSSALPSYVSTFGITPAELASVQADYLALEYARVTLINYARSFSKGITAFADELDTDPTPQVMTVPVFSPPTAPASVESGVFKRVSDLIEAKILPAANESQKTALRLLPLVNPATVSALITDFEALIHGQVALSFRRGGAKLIFIYSRRANESELSLLDKVAGTHFLDTRANLVANQSEARDYAIEFSMDGQKGDGVMSPTVSVATKA